MEVDFDRAGVAGVAFDRDLFDRDLTGALRAVVAAAVTGFVMRFVAGAGFDLLALAAPFAMDFDGLAVPAAERLAPLPADPAALRD